MFLQTPSSKKIVFGISTATGQNTTLVNLFIYLFLGGGEDKKSKNLKCSHLIFENLTETKSVCS